MDKGEVGYALGGGCDTVSISWIGVSTICRLEIGLGGPRYHTRTPKVNPKRLSSHDLYTQDSRGWKEKWDCMYGKWTPIIPHRNTRGGHSL